MPALRKRPANTPWRAVGFCGPAVISWAERVTETASKEQLRKRLLRQIRRQPQRVRLAKGRRIERKLHQLSLYRRARRVLCYVAFDGEVETRFLLKRMLAEGKRVAVPVPLAAGRMIAAEISDIDRDLGTAGRFGIPHPPHPWRPIRRETLDLVIVPALAFDRQGHRLGRGRGYFDRFLARVPRRAARVGLAFGFQVVERLPRLSHDQPVDRVITESSIHENPHHR